MFLPLPTILGFVAFTITSSLVVLFDYAAESYP